ncbi:LysE family transporter [Marivibrio halodurans]|uniref:LysE family transporter n=1 Tax=Marivibrio halodurans TaxID=2039722 RepID=A0A8J7S1S8_9PROT|nr:LysE family transporter [Marivibrio halodurans]MBP5858695.1 LysE family transporter [Marivibrio halodurans]
MLPFAAAVFFLIVTPGPGVLSIAGVGSGFGVAAGNRYLIGLWIGNNAVAAMVASGLAAIVLAEPTVRAVLLYLSVAYLFYLAARIALAGSDIAFVEKEKAPGILNGVTLQLINPKAYAVHTTLFGGFAFLPAQPLAEIGLKFLIMNAIWIPLHYLWLGAGVTLRRLDLAPRTHRAINILMALSMLAVVVLALLAQKDAIG